MNIEELKYFNIDLHIHTCLSPCADWSMTPNNIIKASIAKKLDMIAICDHNSAENIEPVIAIGKRAGIVVLPGMEICSKENIHIIAIFKTLTQALTMQTFIYDKLEGKNCPETFGYQIVADENDNVIMENSRLLIGATNMNIYEIIDKVHKLNGLCIPAHIDRPSFGIISQLGFIPNDLPIDGVEISNNIHLKFCVEKEYKNLSVLTSSDAHSIDKIGTKITNLFAKTPCFEELSLALKQKLGRYLII